MQGGKRLRFRGLGGRGIYLSLKSLLSYLNLNNDYITLLGKSSLIRRRAWMCIFWEQREAGTQGVPPQGVRTGALAELRGLVKEVQTLKTGEV